MAMTIRIPSDAERGDVAQPDTQAEQRHRPAQQGLRSHAGLHRGIIIGRRDSDTRAITIAESERRAPHRRRDAANGGDDRRHHDVGSKVVTVPASAGCYRGGASRNFLKSAPAD
jgi:hypothetical protein